MLGLTFLKNDPFIFKANYPSRFGSFMGKAMCYVEEIFYNALFYFVLFLCNCSVSQ